MYELESPKTWTCHHPNILDEWDLAFVPPPPTGVEDTYRFWESWATKCPPTETNKEKTDPYAKYNFWDVNLTEKFTSELSQTSLGRRFVYQIGLTGQTLNSLKRKRAIPSGSSTKVKRKHRT